MPCSLPIQAIHAAWALQSEGQGHASGYDIVCQSLGGLVEFSFEYEESKWKPKWFKHSLEGLSQIVHIFVGGKGAPTTQTMQTMSSWLDGGNRFERLMEVSETLVDAFNVAIQWPDAIQIKKLAQACGASRGLFAASPMFPTNIAEALSNIPGLDKSWSWKTTGAGGEDAIILVGTKQMTQNAAEKLKEIGWEPSSAQFSMNGGNIISFSTDETKSATKDPMAIRHTPTPRMREFLK
jgi:mevalonate kinase